MDRTKEIEGVGEGEETKIAMEIRAM